MWVRSLLLFIVAGLCEIGGGWLVWQWLRAARPLLWGLCGMGILAAYGVTAAFQPTHFSRAYAAYGGVFIALSLLWGWRVDDQAPDVADLIGASLAVAGALVMMFWPRT